MQKVNKKNFVEYMYRNNISKYNEKNRKKYLQ